MVDQFQGIEENMKPVDYVALYNEAISEAEAERNKRIKEQIRTLFTELKDIDGQIKTLIKKRSKIEGRLRGYSLGQVQGASEE